jgi:hypothetical protein
MTKRNNLFLLLLMTSIWFACKSEPSAPALPPATTPAPTATAPTPETKKIRYVHAASGSILRQTPSADGARIANVPMDGRALEVIALSDGSNAYTAEQYGSFQLKGGWTKVRTPEGKEGYIFDGYLSPYMPFTGQDATDYTIMEKLYRNIANFSGSRESVPKKYDEAMDGYRQRFEDGARFELGFYPGGSTQSMYLPAGKFTQQEALVLFRQLWFSTAKTKTTYDAAKKTLKVTADPPANTLLELIEENGAVTVRFSSAD